MSQNHLKDARSPYLLQHAENPVNWYPWGDEAFKKAAEENKPVIISIGYSSCHWCHVMAHESFEDPHTAELMNASFVSIKIDREERPDLDSYYMKAVQMITGRGGWPLTVFAFPDRRPFYGGTYFPRDSWHQILAAVRDKYRDSPDELTDSADAVEKGIEEYGRKILRLSGWKQERPDLRDVVKTIIDNLDRQEGGVKGAPKFPMPVLFRFLLAWSVLRRDQNVMELVLHTLQKMAAGGLYDRIGGGFARYSTDRYWKVPHFEKMLYDNAQLVSLYSEAYRVTKERKFRQVALESLDFLYREMTSEEGLFFSALDADSSGREGLFYTWESRDLAQILGQDYSLARDWFGVDGDGLWEMGHNILLEARKDQVLAETFGLSSGELQIRQERIKTRLMEARQKRVSPGKDEKALISWNGLMISACCDAYKAFGRREDLQHARIAAKIILDHSDQGTLNHAWKGGAFYESAFLEDYAFLIRSLISLYEVSGGPEYLVKAEELTARVLTKFPSERKGFYTNVHGEQEALGREVELTDSVIPSPNAVMAENLFLLSRLLGKDDYASLAEEAGGVMMTLVEENPMYHAHWAAVALLQSEPFYEVVITGREAQVLGDRFRQDFLPGTVTAQTDSPQDDHLLFKGRFCEDETLIYICRDKSCSLPYGKAEEALQHIRDDG